MRKKEKSGVILIVTMWIALALTSMLLVFARTVRVHLAISANTLSEARAEWIARAGLAYTISLINSSEGKGFPYPSTSFEAIKIGDGYFWLLNPDYDNSSTPAFGIMDESAKINLNTATPEMLMQLPGMTEELAAAISDWCASETMPIGEAGSEYYLLLDPPYHCKEEKFETMEELLLVKGSSLSLLFGIDTNRNGILDNAEQKASGTMMGNIEEWRGFSPFITVHSAPGVSSGQGQQQQQQTQERRPLNTININTAPLQVLYCLPELTREEAESLFAGRPESATDIEWPLRILSQEKYNAILPFIRGDSSQFSADILAVSGDGRAFKRFRAILGIDSQSSSVRVLSWQDLTGLGWPLSSTILQSLRAGKEPPLTTDPAYSGGI